MATKETKLLRDECLAVVRPYFDRTVRDTSALDWQALRQTECDLFAKIKAKEAEINNLQAAPASVVHSLAAEWEALVMEAYQKHCEAVVAAMRPKRPISPRRAGIRTYSDLCKWWGVSSIGAAMVAGK